MQLKKCEVCETEFQARQPEVRTCGIRCRNQLISTEKSLRCPKVQTTKTCVVCSKEFVVGKVDANKQTCSTECKYKLAGSKTSKSVQMQCLTCNKDFLSQLSQLKMPGGGRYCSMQCKYDRNKNQMTRACECCGKLFSSPPSHAHVKTCSTECGYKIRVNPNAVDQVVLNCQHCSKPFEVYPNNMDVRTFCSRKCFDASEKTKERRSKAFQGEGNPGWKGGIGIAAVSASGKSYTRQAPHIENEKSTRRQRAREQATPTWASLQKMQAIYKLAQEVSKKTGILHHVDHCVPLASKLVCGLHNEFNLEILPAIDNLRKHNRHWPDMP